MLSGSGFLFFVVGCAMMYQNQTPAALLFGGVGIVLFAMSYHSYRTKGTLSSGMPVTIISPESPKWKKMVIFLVVIMFLLLWCWVIIDNITKGERLDLSGICWGEC